MNTTFKITKKMHNAFTKATSLIKPFVLMCMIAPIAFTSCKKEALVEQESTEFNTTIDVPLIENPYSVYEQALNSEDLNDEQINIQLAELGVLAKDILKDNQLNDIILEQAKLAQGNTISIQDFIDIAASKVSGKSDNGMKALQAKLDQTDLTYQVGGEAAAKYGDGKYEAAIFALNAETANPTKTPILCLGFSVNNELSGMESYEDYIVGWYVNKNGQQKQVMLDEESAMKSEHPIFIITNAANEDHKNNIQNGQVSNDFNNTVGKTAGAATMEITEYKIDRRCDHTKNSEYSYQLHYWQTNDDGPSGNRQLISKIHKRDVNKMFYNDVDVYETGWINNLEGLSFVTFEYDWYASKKSVYESGPSGSGGASLDCRMKYYGDYYQVFYAEMDTRTENNDHGKIVVDEK